MLRSLDSLFSAAEAVSAAESGNCLLELLAEVVETVRFCEVVGGCTDRRDQAAIGCQQGRGHAKCVCERDAAVKASRRERISGARRGIAGPRLPAPGRRGRGGGTSRRRGRWRAGCGSSTSSSRLTFGLFSASANGGRAAFFAHVGGFLFGLGATWLLARAGQITPQEG